MAKTHRVTIELPTTIVESIDHKVDRGYGSTRSDVMKKSLRFYEWYHTQIDGGDTLVIKNRSGCLRDFNILVL